jgi:hypothetical protein
MPFLLWLWLAQWEPPIGIVRGQILSKPLGSLRVQVAEGREIKCVYDSKSWFEREAQRIEAAALDTGDRVEMVVDRSANGQQCYARTVRVIVTPPQPLGPGQRPSLRRESTSPTEAFAPRGDMTFTGIVTDLSKQWMTIRTRAGVQEKFLLRDDTRYMSGGLRLEHAQLVPATRVFVRAGRNFEGVVEAYQVVWGEIVKP